MESMCQGPSSSYPADRLAQIIVSLGEGKTRTGFKDLTVLAKTRFIVKSIECVGSICITAVLCEPSCRVTQALAPFSRWQAVCSAELNNESELNTESDFWRLLNLSASSSKDFGSSGMRDGCNSVADIKSNGGLNVSELARLP